MGRKASAAALLARAEAHLAGRDRGAAQERPPPGPGSGRSAVPSGRTEGPLEQAMGEEQPFLRGAPQPRRRFLKQKPPAGATEGTARPRKVAETLAQGKGSSSAPAPPKGGPPTPTPGTDTEPPSLGERSAIRSLDELFSAAAAWDEGAASAASAASDFRVNVLSLDDLAPEGGSREKQDPEATLPPAATRSVFTAPKDAGGRGSTSEEEEEETGEAEISERLGSPSEAPPSSSGREGEYSEDFEPPSPSSSSSSSLVASEEGAQSEESRLKASPRSGQLDPSKRFRRRTTDAAVQTGSPPPLPQWLQGRPGETPSDIPIIGLALGGGSAALSLDAVEGLAAHSPSAFALNELLKENLLLIRRFVETSRRLHASLVASLEEEQFHYHTLEEAKWYIKSHKARPREQGSGRREEQDAL